MYRPLVLVSYTLNYRVEGFEVRGLFVRKGDGLGLSSSAPLKAYLEGPAIA